MIKKLIKLITNSLITLYVSIFKKQKYFKLTGEIGTHSELQKKYNLFAENRPIIKLNSKKVPKDLIDLIPLAEKWDIGDDIIRDDFQEKSSDEEKQELKEKLKDRIERIDEWTMSFENGKQMTKEAEAFMYMSIGFDEMQLFDE